MATRTRLAVALLLLVSVTVLSWWTGTGGGGHPLAPSVAISAVVVSIALFKVWLIMREFMEMGMAPAWVRRSSDAWLLVVFAGFFVVYSL